MIPYDDLVAALQAWRARQGLPVSSQASVAAPASNPPPAQRAAPAPPRAPAPPAPAPAAARQPAPLEPAPLEPVDTADENIDNLDSALIEEGQYENEGDDFAMSFGNNGQGHSSGEETLVGEDVPAHNTREDW